MTPEIASIEGGVRLTVAPDGASGSVSVERTLEDVFTAEDTSLKISFEAEENYGDALGVDLIYDDGTGAGPPIGRLPFPLRTRRR